MLEGNSATPLSNDIISKQRSKRKTPFQSAAPDQYTSEQLQNVPMKFKL